MEIYGSRILAECPQNGDPLLAGCLLGIASEQLIGYISPRKRHLNKADRAALIAPAC